MARSLRHLLPVAVAAALVAAGCSSGSDDVTADTATPGSSPAASTTTARADTSEAPVTTAAVDDGAVPLEWSECDGASLSPDVTECATLRVPLDHADPGGALIDIAVARLDTAADADQIGSLVLNPGGPGGSGIEYLAQAASTFPSEVQERFDLVSFDPRGVGASAAVECDIPLDDEVVLLEAGDDAGWAELVADAESLIGRCDESSQALFPWVGTNNAARDLDLLRAALGDEQLSYVGFSYGTRLGATYAELFPDRVRALVLDGAVKPTTDLADLGLQQAAGFDRALDNFASACDADADCPLREIGPALDVVAGLQAEIAEVGSFPTEDADRVLTPGELTMGVVAALYSQDAWPILAQGLYVAEVSQDGSILQALTDSYLGRNLDGTYDNLSEANVAINCADDAVRRDEAEERAVAEESAAASQHFDDLLRASTGCLFVEPALDPLILGPAAGAPPILVIGTTGDPATPYEWAGELAGFLDSGVLYTVEGEGHTAYGSIDCVADVVNAYLIDLEVPADGGSCADDASDDVFLPAGESELDQVVALLACLRENGLDIPEISIADLLADPAGESFAEALDPSDPAFTAAALACQELIPT